MTPNSQNCSSQIPCKIELQVLSSEKNNEKVAFYLSWSSNVCNFTKNEICQS